MKRLILAIILGALAVGFCLLGSVVVNGGVKKVSRHIEQAITACEGGDRETAKAEVKAAADKWKDAQMGFEVFTGNDIIDTVDHGMERMKVMLESKDTEWFVLECREVLLTLKRIAYGESFSFKNMM